MGVFFSQVKNKPWHTWVYSWIWHRREQLNLSNYMRTRKILGWKVEGMYYQGMYYLGMYNHCARIYCQKSRVWFVSAWGTISPFFWSISSLCSGWVPHLQPPSFSSLWPSLCDQWPVILWSSFCGPHSTVFILRSSFIGRPLFYGLLFVVFLLCQSLCGLHSAIFILWLTFCLYFLVFF